MSPRLPGRKPTRFTVPSTEGLLIGSFLMPHEDQYWARPCVIEGCDHRMGNVNWREDRDWQPCSDRALPGFVVHEGNMEKALGIVCQHHAAEILEAEILDPPG